MAAYIAARLVSSIPVLLGVSILIFAIIQLPPGGPVDFYAEGGRLSAADRARLEQQLGLDQPLPIQYLRWLSGIIRGDWGHSYIYQRKVIDVVLEWLPASLQLTIASFVVSVVLAIPLGLLVAVKGHHALRSVVEISTIVGISIPTFWLGLMGIFIFSVALRLLPAGGMYTIGRPFSLIDRLEHLILPVLVASAYWVAAWSRYMRGSILEVMRQDYIRTALAKGLTERSILYRHMLRNALIPFITMVGLRVPHLLSGVVVVEIVFAWPGLGQLLFQSIVRKDYPISMGVFMGVAVLVIIGNLLADVMYAVVDPRIRY